MTWIDKARAKYPLPVEEEGLLVNVVLASVLLTLLAAMACSMMLSVLQGANLWDALTFSWAGPGRWRWEPDLARCCWP